MKTLNSKSSYSAQENAKEKNIYVLNEGITKRLLERYKPNVASPSIEAIEENQVLNRAA